MRLMPLVTCLVAALGMLAAAGAAAARVSGSATHQERINEDARLAFEFTKHAQEYVDLHRKLESTLPALSSPPTPAQVETHQRELTRLLGRARSRAKQGDLFTQEIRAYFRRQIARALSGPDGAQLKTEIMEDNPGRIQVRVNEPYPAQAPLATMPPQVLAALPKLTDELEYRFIGDRLILLDVHAGLVVDYIEGALRSR
jgi:hypothetical protein